MQKKDENTILAQWESQLPEIRKKAKNAEARLRMRGLLDEKRPDVLPQIGGQFATATFPVWVDAIPQDKTTKPKRPKSYTELPNVKDTLTPEEKQIVDSNHKRWLEIAKAKGQLYYSGQVLFITDMDYCKEKGLLYLAAEQARYAFIRSLSVTKEADGIKPFPADSELRKRRFYKAGVFATVITNDDHTLLLQRRNGWFSAPGGFVELVGKNPSLYPQGCPNLLEFTGLEELVEELLGKKNDPLAYQYPISFNHGVLGWHIREELVWPQGGGIYTIDFNCVLRLDCTLAQLLKVAHNNQAQDAAEHTGTAVSVRLADYPPQADWTVMQYRRPGFTFWAQPKAGEVAEQKGEKVPSRTRDVQGRFLHYPNISSAARVFYSPLSSMVRMRPDRFVPRLLPSEYSVEERTAADKQEEAASEASGLSFSPS